MPKQSDRDLVAEGVPHPRGGTGFREIAESDPERAGAAERFMDTLHAEAVPKMQHILGTEAKELREGMATKRGSTEAKKTRLESLEGALSDLANHPASAMEAGISRVTETAMAPVHAVRQHLKDTGVMLGVHAGEFYGARHDIGREMAGHYFAPGSEEHMRALLATPEWSARTTPQQEVMGASGMLAMLKHGEHVGISIGSDLANLFNTPENEGGWKGGHGGVGLMKPGDYTFAQLAQHHPQAAMILMQHHVKESGLVVPQKSKYTEERLAVTQARQGVIRSSSEVDLPEELEPAAAAMVSGMGQTGFPKGARSLSRFYTDPGLFGGGSFHKIGSYTWNIHRHDPVMAAGTHHFLGVMAHGKKWLEAHPEAHQALAAAKAHPAWGDPTSTIDVWSGRVASGFPFHATSVLGQEATNPENIMRGGVPRRQRGQRYGSPGDMGYFWGEEVHRQAARSMSINVKGVGKMYAPPHVVQSLSWYGVQAEENANMIKQGKRTMAPTSMQDVSSLNSLQFPQVFL